MLHAGQAPVQRGSRADRDGILPACLSSADVAQIAREEGLEAFAEELSAYARPGWHLLAGGADRPAASKVGGDPDLGEGER